MDNDPCRVPVFARRIRQCEGRRQTGLVTSGGLFSRICDERTLSYSRVRGVCYGWGFKNPTQSILDDSEGTVSHTTKNRGRSCCPPRPAIQDTWPLSHAPLSTFRSLKRQSLNTPSRSSIPGPASTPGAGTRRLSLFVIEHPRQLTPLTPKLTERRPLDLLPPTTSQPARTNS
jgi:hypothetical protein